ncbi:MAG: site-specific DNA-methyltransferase [Mollicutes bacterium]|nr:site-specific DNA-methyltransferase [Mollicutes bacterium]
MDCTKGLKLINNQSVDIVLSDIPYGINFDDWDVLHTNTNSALMGTTEHQLKDTTFKKRGKPINGWNKTDKKISIEYYEWCKQWCKELFRVTKEASPILLFSSRRYLHRVCCALEDEGFLIRDILIWQKDRCNAKAQRINNVLHKRGIYDDSFNDYRIGNLAPMYEPIIWAMKPYSHTLTDCVLENKIGGFYGENDTLPSNIFYCPINIKNKYHPTEKPLQLIKDLIKTFSIDNKHIILDPFMGSGTTAVACKELDRNYIGFELIEKYCQITIERINNIKIQ